MVRHPDVISNRLRPFRVGPDSSAIGAARRIAWWCAAVLLLACVLSLSDPAAAQQAAAARPTKMPRN